MALLHAQQGRGEQARERATIAARIYNAIGNAECRKGAGAIEGTMSGLGMQAAEGSRSPGSYVSLREDTIQSAAQDRESPRGKVTAMENFPTGIVLSIFPDSRGASAHREPQPGGDTLWRHTAISGSRARSLLRIGNQIRRVLALSSTAVREGEDFAERASFSRALCDALEGEPPADRYLVVFPSGVPIDTAALPDGRCLGDVAVISHVFARRPLRKNVLRRLVSPVQRPLGSHLLVCPMAMDRFLPRHLQDIMRVAMELEGDLPVEIWLQPRFRRAGEAFARKDAAWLHIDTHGDEDGGSLMLGPTREDGKKLSAAALPRRIAAPLVVAVGCALTAGQGSIGNALLKRGAISVFGPCAAFESLGIANSEEGQAVWYRTLFRSLLDGLDVGCAVREARRKTPGGLVKYAWLLLGSSRLAFPGLNARAKP